MKFTLEIRCRRWNFHWSRSMRLIVNPGTEVEVAFYSVDATIESARLMASWAELNGVELVYDPPGNLADGYELPPEPPKAAPLPVGEASF
jgi:hypothetical protein